MLRRLLSSLLPVALLLAAAGTTSVAFAGDPCFHDLSRPAPTTGFAAAIAIEECTFGPTVSHVAIGQSVVWTNTSQQPHEIAGANLSWGAHDTLIEPGRTMEWTFAAAGVYPYACMIHPGMTGAVVVGDATADGAETSGQTVTETTPPADGGDALGVGVAVIGLASGVLALAALAAFGLVRRRQGVAG